MIIKLILSLLLFISTYQTLACFCALSTLEERIKTAPEIFVGKVLRVEPFWQKEGSGYTFYHRTVFQVQKIYKGQVFSTEVLVHDPYSASCGISFDQDSVYLVFTEEAPWLSKSTLTSGECSGSSNINSIFGEETVLKLDKLAAEVELIPTMGAHRLYNVTWKDESFLFTEEREKLLLDYLDISKLRKEFLSICVIDSVFPLTDLDSLFLENWDFLPNEVSVEFEIDEKGQISNVKVADDLNIDEDCQNKAIAFGQSLHPWKPASIRGIPVKSNGWYSAEFAVVKSRQ